MEAVFTLKRVLEINYKLCISCQKRNKPKDDVRETTDYSKTVVCEAKVKRRNLRDVMRCDERDVNNREVIDPLDHVPGRSDISIVWHSNCYAQYICTSKEKIESEKRKFLASVDESHKVKGARVPSCTTCSQVEPVRWEKCMFCWMGKPKGALISCQMSDQILEVAPFHYKVRLRVEACNLIAAGAKYHLACFAFFPRSTEKAKSAPSGTELALIWLCKELKYAAEKSHLIELTDAWERYVALAGGGGGGRNRNSCIFHQPKNDFRRQVASYNQKCNGLYLD